MDTYSKFVQTIIAVALVWLCVRPMLESNPVDAQTITNVRVVDFDIRRPIPVVSDGTFPVNIVGSAGPLAVKLSGPLPLPIVTRWAPQ